MQEVDKNIENLIVRRLDGELAEQDELALDRELIRNPAAREMLDSYERMDQLASGALKSVIGTQQTQIDVQSLPKRAVALHRTSHRWMWQLATGAIAAAILAVFVARFTPGSMPSQTPVVNNLQPRAIPPVITVAPNLPGRENVMRNVGNTRPKTWRDTGRETFGVVGDDGNLYWIGIDRTRTAKPNRSERM